MHKERQAHRQQQISSRLAGSTSRIVTIKSPLYGRILEQDHFAYHLDIIFFSTIVHISANNFLHDNNRKGDYTLNYDCEDNYLHHEYTYCPRRVNYIAGSIDFCRSRHYNYNLYICCELISKGGRW
ncbi:hypothetical protein KCU95_g271, partial [Aureobasidium melanogenum]